MKKTFKPHCLPLVLWCVILAAAVSCSVRTVEDESVLKMLVGTYTEGTGSKGVYLYEFDTATLEARLLDCAFAPNPSFVIPSDDRRFAYSVSETSDGSHGVYSFELTDSTINVLNKREGSGSSPCNIVIAGGNVLTSDYGDGTLTVFPLLPDGRVAEKSFSYDPGADVESHIHCAVVSPDGKYLFFTDLGADAVYRATIIPDSNPEDFRTAYSFDRTAHPGPRHMVFSTDGRNAYLLGETGDCVTVFAYDDGELRHISTEMAYDGRGHGSADIHISPDGRFLYTSHRLKEDGISVFRINPGDGTLERTGFQPTGRHPRNFTLTPDGKYLLCACRDAGSIEIYSVDAQTGVLDFTGKTVAVPSPVCISLY
ncbi:MAG: lactonase family protein [Bacteroidales bacterium]|nr:lactonase family protein [Bacteroidales bacterium]